MKDRNYSSITARTWSPVQGMLELQPDIHITGVNKNAASFMRAREGLIVDTSFLARAS